MNSTPVIVSHAKTAFDDWRSIAISIYLALSGYSVLVAIPILSSHRVNLLGFSEIEAGRLSSADLGGLAFGAMIASWVRLPT